MSRARQASLGDDLQIVPEGDRRRARCRSSNSAKPRTLVRGLFSSWATPAASSPTAASLAAWTNCAWVAFNCSMLSRSASSAASLLGLDPDASDSAAHLGGDGLQCIAGAGGNLVVGVGGQVKRGNDLPFVLHRDDPQDA